MKVVDGLMSANLSFSDATSAWAASQYIAMWLRGSIVGQQPPFHPGPREKPPVAPPWLHPSIQVAYGWFGFHNGSGDVSWVPWSAFRSAVATDEMAINIILQNSETWEVACSSHRNAASVANVIAGCGRFPVEAIKLHDRLVLLGYNLRLGTIEGTLACMLNWGSIGTVNIRTDTSLGISSAAGDAPAETMLLFPDAKAAALAIEWLEWWWSLRPAASRPQEALCRRDVAQVVLTADQILVEQHSGLMQHAELPMLPNLENRKNLLDEKKRKSAATRAASEGDITRASAILDNNTPSRPTDATVFGQLAALQLKPPSAPVPLVRMPGVVPPVITLKLVLSIIEALNPRAAAGVSGHSNRMYKQMLSPKVSDEYRFWILQATMLIIQTIAAGAEEGQVYRDGEPASAAGQFDVFSRLARRARACALPKPRKPGMDPSAPDPIRPIAVGETIYRLALRVIFKAVGDTRIVSALLSSQFGVACKGGVEPMVLTLRSFYLDGIGIVCLDMVNAFNAMHRSSIQNPTRNLLPELAKAMHWSIGTKSILLVKMDDGSIGTLYSETGTRQGCPFSSLAYSLGMRAPVLELIGLAARRFLVSAVRLGRFDLLSPTSAPATSTRVTAPTDGDEPMPAAAPVVPDHGDRVQDSRGMWWRLRDDVLAFMVSAYIDDTYVLALTLEDAIAARNDAVLIFGKHGLQLNIPKCHFVHRPTFERDGGVEGVLGAHLGDDKVVSRLLVQKVAEVEHVFSRLRLWHEWGATHLALLLLRLCVVPKYTYPARTEVPAAAHDALALLGSRVLATLRAFMTLGRAFTYAEIVYITNPVALGGLGFSSLLSFIHSLPYAAAIIDSHARLRARKIVLNVVRIPEAVDSIARGAHNLSGSLDLGSSPSVAMILALHPRRLTQLGKKMTRRWYLQRFLPIVLSYTNNPTARNLRRFAQTLEHSTSLGSAWLSCTPNRSIAFLSSIVITIALRSRILAESVFQLPGTTVCTCGCQVIPDLPILVGDDDSPMSQQDARDMECELSLTRIQTFSIHAERCVKAATIRVNLHTDGVGIVASAHRAAGHTVVVEETYNKAVSGARADVTAVFHGPPNPGGTENGQTMRPMAELPSVSLEIDGEGLGPQQRGSVINIFPTLAAQTMSDKPSAAVERVDLSFACLQLRPGGRPLVPCTLSGINTAEEERVFKSVWEAAKVVAFLAVSVRAKAKRAHHGGLVLPLVMSLGGGIFADADALLPQVTTDTSTRSYCRQKLSCRLVHYLAVRQVALHARLEARTRA